MSTSLLSTKLNVPPGRAQRVARSRLVEKLAVGLHHKLTLVAAPAGFGKTTLVSTWVAGCDRQVAWLSLDEGDNDLERFLTYLVASLQTIAPAIGVGLLAALRSSQPPPVEVAMTDLLNEITTGIQHKFLLVLDDYHVIDSKPIDDALTFLLEHMPSHMHLVIATREDPRLPLARLRARDQLTELRVTDLRFTPSEATSFLHVMGLDLSAQDIEALETRTEGWIAGLQLAALSLQGHQDRGSFIQSFTGSSRFIIDYLAEEVLERQSDEVRAFLLRTSILGRMCASLCDAVRNVNDEAASPAGSPELTLSQVSSRSSSSSQAMLEKLERSNLFIVALDNERGWYRYHHLFADLLRQRLLQSVASSASEGTGSIAELHIRASRWYEENGLEKEAFHHAAAANDVERAERLVQGSGIPLYFRGTVAPVLNWLESLPRAILDATPLLWVIAASAQLQVDHTGVEQKLRSAEAAMQQQQAAMPGIETDGRTRDITGRIASMRATVAVVEHDVAAIIAQSRRALDYLHPDNLALRTAATWSLGHAYQLQGDRAEAGRAYTEVVSISKSLGSSVYAVAATINLGQIQEANNKLHLATGTYKRALQIAGDPPQPITCEAHTGLARIYYQWNDLEAAERHGQQCLEQTRDVASDLVDALASSHVLLARVRLALGDGAGAAAILASTSAFVRRNNFAFRMPEVVAAQVQTLIGLGNLAEAAHLARSHNLSLCQARVQLAMGDVAAAMAILEPLRQEAEAKGWADERLKVMLLQAIALHAHGERDQAVLVLGEALSLAEPEGFIRIFVDEGPLMQALLQEAAGQGITFGYTGYVHQLLAAFRESTSDRDVEEAAGRIPGGQLLIEPLSERELEVLRLLGTELNGPEIAGELMVSLNTMRTHSKNIYNKLGVNNRRAALRRAEELHLL